MSRILITGSTDGLGRFAAQSLLSQGHRVVLHARNTDRAQEVRASLPTAEHVVIGDLSVVSQIGSVAEQVNQLGRFDAVIHNAGVYVKSPQSGDGLPITFAVNTLAPYMLTALIQRPQRLVYLSSSMHAGASADFSDIDWKRRAWNAVAAYSESKLYVLMLALAVARYWPDVGSNAVDPGWVPTRMGGSSATDDLDEGYRTQVWLAVSQDKAACVSGKYFYHRRQQTPDSTACDENKQDQLIAICSQLSGITLE